MICSTLYNLWRHLQEMPLANLQSASSEAARQKLYKVEICARKKSYKLEYNANFKSGGPRDSNPGKTQLSDPRSSL